MSTSSCSGSDHTLFFCSMFRCNLFTICRTFRIASMTTTKFRPNQKVRMGWILVNFLITTIVWLLESSIFEITTFFFSSVSNVLKEGRSSVTHAFVFNHVMIPPFYPLFFSTFYFCHLIDHVHFHIDALHVLSFTYEIFFSFKKYMLRCNCFWNRKCNRLAVRVSWSYGSWLFWKSELRQLTTLKARIIFLWAQQRIDRWNRLFQFLNLRTKIWWASIRFRGFCDYSTRQGDSTNFWSNKGIKDVINRKVRGSTRDCFDKYSRCSWMTCTYRVGWWCNQGWKHVLEGLPGSLSKWKVYAGGQRDLLCL